MSEAMTILALESSAGPASCALVRWEKGERNILSTASVNNKITHSQTLMPMVDQLLKNAGIPMEQVDHLAVSAGPGSFTGIRIGVAAVKGLAFARNLPCAGVSTLEAMAHNLDGLPYNGLILTAMDARCQQIYTALFSCEDGQICRLTPDEALPLSVVKERLISEKKPLFTIGDGAQLCYNELKASLPGLQLAPEQLRYQHATGVAAAALTADWVSGETLLPVYLRLPQAERELRQRRTASSAL